MNALASHINRNRLHYALLLGIMAVFFVMNILTTLKGDEYVYALVPGDPRRHCTSLAEYVSTIPAFYTGTNGRLADALERLTASLVGKPLFNVANTLVFAMMIEGIFTLAIGRRRDPMLLAALATLILVCFPYPGETMLWMAGAFNYMWAVTLNLWLLIWLRRRLQNPAPAGVATHIGVFAAALLAGDFNETASTAVLAGLAVYFALNRRWPRGVVLTACVGYLLGLLVIFCSPAFWWRIGLGAQVNTGLDLVQVITRRAIAFSWMTVRFVAPLAALAITLWLLRREGRKSFAWTLPRCMLIGSAVAALALGMVIERPYLFYVAASTVVVIDWLAPRVTSRRWIGWAFALALGPVCAAHALVQMTDYRDFNARMISDIASGDRQCILRAKAWQGNSRWVVPDDYDNGSDLCYYRTAFSQYFGKDNVQFLSPEIYDRYMSGRLTADTVEVAMNTTNPDIARRAFAVKGQPYTLILAESPDSVGNSFGKVYYADGNTPLDQNTRRQRYLLGTLRDHTPCRPYFLTEHGQTYYVVPVELTKDVTKINLRINDINDRQHMLTLTRK